MPQFMCIKCCTNFVLFFDFFGSRTDPISLLILLLLFFFLLGWHSKKPKASSFQIGMGWHLTRLYFNWQSYIFWYDAILSRWCPWRLPAIHCSIRRLLARLPSMRDFIGSLYALQSVIHSTFILVLIICCENEDLVSVLTEAYTCITRWRSDLR